MSVSFSSTYVGRPWLHWPEFGTASISRKSAFISSGLSFGRHAPSRNKPSLPKRASGGVRVVENRPIPPMLGEIADKAPDIDFAQHRWRLAHRDRARTKGSMIKPKGPTRRSASTTAQRRLHRVLRFPDQQYRRATPDLRSPLHTLIYDALMRGVLIDNHEAVAGLRDNVGLMNLGSRSA